jgi:hypothetical protein
MAGKVINFAKNNTWVFLVLGLLILITVGIMTS